MTPTLPPNLVGSSVDLAIVQNVQSFSEEGVRLWSYQIGAYEHFTSAYSNSTPRMRFDNLAAQWEQETINMSSTEKISANNAYQQIIGMGPKVLPYILQRMTERPGHWFWALAAITGTDPVPKSYIGDVRAMTAFWLDWGKKNGYLYP